MEQNLVFPHGCRFDCYNNPILPGNKAKRSRARKLEALEIRPDVWLVTGGELGHGVIVLPDGRYRCDCGRQPYATDQICSHALAVDMARFPSAWARIMEFATAPLLHKMRMLQQHELSLHREKENG